MILTKLNIPNFVYNLNETFALEINPKKQKGNKEQEENGNKTLIVYFSIALL